MRLIPTMAAASLVLALVAAGMQTSARAQTQAVDPHHPATQAQPATAPPQAATPLLPAATGQSGMSGGGMNMMAEMMGQMMRQMMAPTGAPLVGMMERGGTAPFSGLPFERIEGRLAFMKAELAITEAQMPQWDATTAALRAAAATLLVAARELQETPAPPTALEKLERLERIHTLQLEAIRTCRSAFTPLYAVLDDAQKRTADELMLGAMGVG